MQHNRSIKVHLTAPHPPWQQVIYEQTAGLLRKHFPKSTGFRAVSTQQLPKVVKRVNQKNWNTVSQIDTWNELLNLINK